MTLEAPKLPWCQGLLVPGTGVCPLEVPEPALVSSLQPSACWLANCRPYENERLQLNNLASDRHAHCGVGVVTLEVLGQALVPSLQ